MIPWKSGHEDLNKKFDFDFDFLHKYEYLVFIEIKHKVYLDTIYFKAHSTIIKFPTLEISTECGVGFTYDLHNILRGIYLCHKVLQL